MTEPLPFWENYFVWYEAMLVALISAGTLAYLGVWVAVKKVTWVPLALSQVSAAGVMTAFLLHDLLGLHDAGQEATLLLLDPAGLSFLAAIAIAFYFGRPNSGGQRGVVIAYLISSALVLLVGGFVRQDLHDMKDVLFGHAVLADLTQVGLVAIAAALVVGIHLLYYRRILFVSFDPKAAGAAGFHVFATEVLLYSTMAIMLSATTRAMGALPAFGLCVLPALASLGLCRTMARAVLLSVLIGLFSAGSGYYLSFTLELSAGASMVAVAGFLLGLSWLASQLRR